MSNLLETIERAELIAKLREKGFGDLVDAFLINEDQVYTKRGRLNKSGACRVLDWKTKQLEDTLLECKKLKKLLYGESDDEDEVESED